LPAMKRSLSSADHDTDEVMVDWYRRTYGPFATGNLVDIDRGFNSCHLQRPCGSEPHETHVG
jgi:hypothetical protein